MMLKKAKLAVAGGVTLVTVVGVTAGTALIAATAAYASIGPDQTVTGSLAPGTDMTFSGDIDGISITVSCKNFSATGKTSKKPATKFKLSAPPTVNGCTDSLGGTDTIVTKGKWSFSVNSAGTEVTLTIPKKGATFTSSVESGCTITAAPKKSNPVTGSYNDSSGTVTVSNASIATSGSGCSSGPATTNATVVLSPNPGAPPWG